MIKSGAYPIISTTAKHEFMVAESAGGVAGQMAGVQERLNFPAGTGVTPFGVTATELAQRRALSSVRAGVGQDTSVTKLVSTRYIVIHLLTSWIG